MVQGLETTFSTVPSQLEGRDRLDCDLLKSKRVQSTAELNVPSSKPFQTGNSGAVSSPSLAALLIWGLIGLEIQYSVCRQDKGGNAIVNRGFVYDACSRGWNIKRMGLWRAKS